MNWLNNIRNKIDKRETNTNINREHKNYHTKFTFINKQTNKIAQIFRNKFKLNIAFSTNNNIRNLIGKHNLNNVDSFENSGIHRLECQADDCDSFYLGQTGRSYETRFKEHQMSVKYGCPSAFSTHAFEKNHSFSSIQQILKNSQNIKQRSRYEHIRSYRNLFTKK